MDPPDVTVPVAAFSKMRIGGWLKLDLHLQYVWIYLSSSKLHIQCVQWIESSATSAFSTKLKKLFINEIIHIYANNEAAKCKLMKMRSNLKLPDLQMLSSEVCKSSTQCVQKVYVIFITNPFIIHSSITNNGTTTI